MRTRQKVTLLVFGILMALMMAVGRVNAQPVCGRHVDLVGQLDTRYKEHVRVIGVTRTGSLLEVFESAGGATWTILMTLPDGNSCAVFAGENLRVRDPVVTERRAGWQPPGR